MIDARYTRFFTIMNFSAGYMRTIMQLVSCTKKTEASLIHIIYDRCDQCEEKKRKIDIIVPKGMGKII